MPAFSTSTFAPKNGGGGYRQAVPMGVIINCDYLKFHLAFYA